MSARLCASSPASAHYGHQQGDSWLAQVARALTGEVIALADRALHEAKDAGREREVCLHEEQEPASTRANAR